MQQPPPPQPNPPIFFRFSVMGFGAACGATALVFGIIAWIHSLLWRHKLADMYGGYSKHGPMVGHGGMMHVFGPVHALIFAILAGIAGLVFAAVYNAVSAPRR
jgi:hypothetical protein